MNQLLCEALWVSPRSVWEASGKSIRQASWKIGSLWFDTSAMLFHPHPALRAGGPHKLIRQHLGRTNSVAAERPNWRCCAGRERNQPCIAWSLGSPWTGANHSLCCVLLCCGWIVVFVLFRRVCFSGLGFGKRSFSCFVFSEQMCGSNIVFQSRVGPAGGQHCCFSVCFSAPVSENHCP